MRQACVLITLAVYFLRLTVGFAAEPEHKVVAAPDEKVGFAESLGIKLVSIPSGEFTMGSSDLQLDRLFEIYPKLKKSAFSDEKPAHVVLITNLAAMSVHEITVGQFQKFVDETEYQTEAERDGKGGLGWNDKTGRLVGPKPEYSWKRTGFPQTEAHPVVNVSWNDAVAFCEWLSKKDGRKFRLPTEAEWEYCARAGSPTLYTNGDDRHQLTRIANVADSQARAKLTNYPEFSYEDESDGFVFTAPVGSFPANQFGLHDTLGNVSEWCADGYEERIYGNAVQKNPEGPRDGSRRVMRGGSWLYDGSSCRSASRLRQIPTFTVTSCGFRLAVSR